MPGHPFLDRSEEHTSELQSLRHLVCRLLLEKKKIQLRQTPRRFGCPTACLRAGESTPPLIPTSLDAAPALPSGTATSYFPSVFFFNDTATTEIYTLSLHDALPISLAACAFMSGSFFLRQSSTQNASRSEEHTSELQSLRHLVCRHLLEKRSRPAPITSPAATNSISPASLPHTPPA